MFEILQKNHIQKSNLILICQYKSADFCIEISLTGTDLKSAFFK